MNTSALRNASRKLPRGRLGVRHGRQIGSAGSQLGGVSVQNDPFLIAAEEMGHPGCEQYPAAGSARGAKPVDHDTNLFDMLTYYGQGIGQCGEQDHRGPVLVIMHDRNVQ
jgi:hypothetical protein